MTDSRRNIRARFGTGHSVACVPKKRPPFFNNSVKNQPILIIFDMLNPEIIWHEYLTDLSTSPVICCHFTLGNLKSHFSTLLFTYFRLFTLAQKKTSSNCCSAALAIYSMLFSASYYLHSPSTAPGTHYRRSAWTCWGLRQRLVAACAEFQHSDWLVSKKTGSMY